MKDERKKKKILIYKTTHGSLLHFTKEQDRLKENQFLYLATLLFNYIKITKMIKLIMA